MKILLVFDSLSPFSGGSQNAVMSWFKNLKKLGVKVKLLTDQNYKKTSEKIDETDLIVNRSFALGKQFSNFSFSPILWNGAKKQILSFNPDIVNIQEQLVVSYQALRFAKKNNYLTLATMHGDPYKFRAQFFPFSLFIKEGSIFNRLLRKCQFSMLKESDYITVPTHHYQSLITQKLHKKPFVLASPVSSYFFNKSAVKPKRVNKLITVSRLAGEKHVDVLIDMMRYLKDRYTLTIMGEGIDKQFLINKVKELKLDSVINFFGWVSIKKLSETLRNHHLFLSASNFETFGLTYIEGLASALPCVAYDYPVSREVIPNEMAIFVNSLDPKKWAEKLILIQEHPEIYSKLKQNIENNYQKIYRYNEVESTKKLLQIYEEILNESNRGHSAL